NDTKTSVRTYLGRAGIENFQGKLIIADPTERNIVIPSSAPPQYVCGDRGCSVSLIYSTDGGRTFYGNRFMRSFDPYRDTEQYTVLVTRDAYFIEKRFSQNFASVDRFPLIPGFRYGHDILPDADKVQFNTKMPSGLRSPSGQERFACDASIRPTNPDAPLK
ncbi:T6SS immunity protein Tli3 family protein, partial [Caballeronia glebae]